ncbi:hypothetical protein [Clostridium sp.]|uniref:hypothetical protein n=1 Tax=Clostridium sp. TaxID=1506 RepID=UPI00290CE5B9|nr:hypothetical protein [Clostridium sp.]MDU7213018.1 hypothetical protein [Clostridium sp.]
MDEILIKSVGKKVIVSANEIIIKKTIGKDIEIPLKNVNDISYTEGMSNKAGFLYIYFINGNEEVKKEEIPFNYVYNDIVEEVVRGILNHLKNPDEALVIEQKEKVGLFKQVNKEAKKQSIEKAEQKKEEKERLLKLQKEGIPYCPKCHSTSLTTTNKKLSVGRAAVGGALLGGTGAILGGLTSKKVELLCMNCGHKFKPGKK